MTIHNEYRFLKKIYKDIILGYSYIQSENIYIKHPCEIDLGFIEDLYIQHFNEAKIRGLPDEKEKIKELCEAEIWFEEKEKKIIYNQRQISNLKDTLKKIFIKSQTTSVNNQIKELEKELKEISEEREKLIGTTAEKYANKKSNEMIIYRSFFKDQNLKETLFTEEMFDEMELQDLTKYILIYNKVMENFNQKNLKKIAALPFFLNISFLAEDNIFIFYGKSIIQLSNFQIELFSNGRSYKNVISKGVNPSEEYYDNLDDLVEWYELNKSIKDASEVKFKSKDPDGMTYIGASKEEIKLINKVSNSDEIIDLAKEDKELSMQDLIKLQGL